MLHPICQCWVGAWGVVQACHLSTFHDVSIHGKVVLKQGRQSTPLSRTNRQA
jgi:hypothetical protein